MSTSAATQSQDMHLYTSDEKRTLHLVSLLTLAVMYGGVVLAVYVPVVLPAVIAINVFSVVRYAGYIHALNHAYYNERVSWLLEVLPSIWTPFLPGFSEVQRIHLAHHEHTNGAGDPDAPLITGRSKLWVLIKCSFIYEYWFFYMLRNRWMTERFWIGYAIRVGLMLGLIALVGPWMFLIALAIPAKVGTGMSFFIFSYLAHVQGGKHGTYTLPTPTLLVIINHILVGRYASDPANFHALHHAKPWLSCGQLDKAMPVHGS